MDGRILYEAGPEAFAARPLVVGRSRECDWCTAGIDGTLSAKHAELSVKRGALVIRDLGSRNGIQFKGERVREHRFAPGDVVLLGACKISVEPVRAAASGGQEFHRLERLNGPDAGDAVELRVGAGEEISIGSDPSCDILCADTVVSRRHAVLSIRKDGSCWIKDAGSRNGTTVGGAPLAAGKERLLRDGDVVGVAHYEFRFLDKDAVHVRARAGRKLLVAAGTVAVAAMAFSTWNLARTNARKFLALARGETEKWTVDQTDFSPAFEFLDLAENARQADLYRGDIKDDREKFCAWTNTICAWREVRELLEKGRWISARKEFNRLSSWTWNAANAPVAKREAEAVQKLVNEFVDARDYIAGRDWSSDGAKETAGFAKAADKLSGALSDAPDPEIRKWAGPIVSETAALLAEFREETNELAKVSAILGSLVPADDRDPEPDAARRAAAALDGLLAANAARGREQAEKKVAFGGGTPAPRPQPFFSKAVEVCATAARQPLEGLVAAEGAVETNLMRVAETRFDSVCEDLPFPDRTVTDSWTEVKRYREFLERKNAELLGPVRDEWKSRLDGLAGKGFDFRTGKAPEAFSGLADDALAAGVRRFVPVGAPDPFVSESGPVCEYDRFVGAEALSAYLGELRHGRSQSWAAAQYDKIGKAPSKREWRTVVQDLRDGLSTLRSFDRFAGDRASGMVKLVRTVEVPGGRNMCAEAETFVSRQLTRVEVWVEDFADACEDAGGERAKLLGEAVSLLLSGNAPESKAKSLGTSFNALQEEIWKVFSAVNSGETAPAAGWREIFDMAIPSDDKAWTESLKKLSAMEGARGP
ncbi:MAG: FHA domain-containing protein [Kiritimatiellae bacterium]|nr:FHA domain-containing protein [Kiritimatiellia bacterium]